MEEIEKYVITFAEVNNRYPTLLEFGQVGITRAMIRTAYGNIAAMKSELHPKLKDHIFDLEMDKRKSFKQSTKRFVITTAVIGGVVDKKFYKNIKAYCKDESAELIVLPSFVNNTTAPTLDPIFKDDVVVLEDTLLNSNVFLLGIKNNAKGSDPITGLPRIGRRNGTFITASPKQRLKFVATGINKLAHALMSTGAITLPEYESKGLMTDKSSYMATHDHVMGAVILELDKDDTFHFRQIQADAHGSFVDLGTMYKNSKRIKMAPEAFIIGDWHSGESDPTVVKCWQDVTKTLNIPRWVIHDGISFNAANHHIVGKQLTLAKMAKNNLLSLEDELETYAEDLIMMSDLLKEVVIVASNHDEFLTTYLDEGRYVNEPHNHRISLDLAAAQIDGHNPIKYYMEEMLKLKLKNVRWLERDEDYSIAGIQLGAHGDEGANGARGNANALENAYGDAVSGHSHTPQILRGSWVVGTTSYLQLSYNSGPSSWFHTSCLVYPNGMRQLINCLGEGKWTTRKL